MLSLGWNVITRAAPSWWHVNLGTTYLNVPLATVHHLYNVTPTALSKSYNSPTRWDRLLYHHRCNLADETKCSVLNTLDKAFKQEDPTEQLPKDPTTLMSHQQVISTFSFMKLSYLTHFPTLLLVDVWRYCVNPWLKVNYGWCNQTLEVNCVWPTITLNRISKITQHQE